MNNHDQINRLGFNTWADNLIADFLENNKGIMVLGEGNMTVEKTDGTTIRAVYKDKSATIVVRGHSHGGWQIHERTLKL